MAMILSTATAVDRDAAVARAVAQLRTGQVVALPTETVYGLAANALDADAVARIFAIKGRPAHNPIIVHVADLDMARRIVADWPASADRLAERFWPGPLTMVLPRAPIVPDVVTAGGTTVGIRWPRHPVMQAVIRACGFPLAAPSANRSNAISPTTAAHVQQSIGDRLDLIVDGGPAPVGIESTVIDLAASPPRVLRPGRIDAQALASVLDEPVATGPVSAVGMIRSPGMLARHYSPRARLVISTWHDDADLDRQIEQLSTPRAQVYVLAYGKVPPETDGLGVVAMPHEAEAYAQRLYADLYRADNAGADVILVEALPEGMAWDALRDRLSRAAAR